MLGYVSAGIGLPTCVCFELPAREASSFYDFWQFTSCDFIAFISLLVFFEMCLLRITLPNLCPHKLWFMLMLWISVTLWTSDKFLLTLSVYQLQTHCASRPYYNVWSSLSCIYHALMLYRGPSYTFLHHSYNLHPPTVLTFNHQWRQTTI